MPTEEATALQRRLFGHSYVGPMPQPPYLSMLHEVMRQDAVDPFRMLAIAVVGMAYKERDSVDEVWVELAGIDARRCGVRVA